MENVESKEKYYGAIDMTYNFEILYEKYFWVRYDGVLKLRTLRIRKII